MEELSQPVIIETSFQTALDDIGDVLTENEPAYPIHGELITEAEMKRISVKHIGLNRYWDCISKNIRAKHVLGRGNLCIGSLLVYSADNKTNFGYNFNPPLEFHAWLEYGGGIIDVALPGVITKGLTSKDEHGYFLVGREPFILAGAPPNWLKYRAVLHVRGDWETYPLEDWLFQ